MLWICCRLACSHDSSSGESGLVVASWEGTLRTTGCRATSESQLLQKWVVLWSCLGETGREMDLGGQMVFSLPVFIAPCTLITASAVPVFHVYHMLNNTVLTGDCSSQTNYSQGWLMLQSVCKTSLSVWCLKVFYQQDICHIQRSCFQPAERTYCKLETSAYEGICMIIAFFCIFYLLCVERHFSMHPVVETLPELSKWALILLLTKNRCSHQISHVSLFIP